MNFARHCVMAAFYFGLFTAAVVGEEPTKDSLDTVKKNLTDKKAILLDVREKEEWNAGHLQQAINVPLSKLKGNTDAKTLIKDVDPKAIIYCHCQAGRRALTAAELLKKQGYDVRPLKQGYDELLSSGFTKAKTDPSK